MVPASGIGCILTTTYARIIPSGDEELPYTVRLGKYGSKEKSSSEENIHSEKDSDLSRASSSKVVYTYSENSTGEYFSTKEKAENAAKRLLDTKTKRELGVKIRPFILEGEEPVIVTNIRKGLSIVHLDGREEVVDSGISPDRLLKGKDLLAQLLRQVVHNKEVIKGLESERRGKFCLTDVSRGIETFTNPQSTEASNEGV